MTKTSQPESAPVGTDGQGQVSVPQTRVLELLGNAVTQRTIGAMQVQIEGMQAYLQVEQKTMAAREHLLSQLQKENEHLKKQLDEFKKNAAAMDDTRKVK